jgi:hypothetical protein
MWKMPILHLLYLVLAFIVQRWLIPHLPYVVLAIAVLGWLLDQEIDSPAVRFISPAPRSILDLPIEVRTMIYQLFIPDIDIIYLANQQYPFSSAPASWWTNLNLFAASHPVLCRELLHELYRLRAVYIPSGELVARCLYRRLIHLDYIVNLQINLGSISELHVSHRQPIMYQLLCHRCRQLQKLTLYVHVIDQALFDDIAAAACAQLTSITGLRDRTLRPRLILYVTVELVPRRPSEGNVHTLASAFSRARAQYRFRSIQVPMLLRTIEIHITLTARERESLEHQWFYEPGGSWWRFVTRAGQQVNEFRMTWTDGRSEDEIEDSFDQRL